MAEKYQAKRVVVALLQGGTKEVGPCTVLVDSSGCVALNWQNPEPVDRMDMLTHISRCEIYL